METIANQRSESINRLINCMTPNALKHRPGPDSTKLMDILEKNGMENYLFFSLLEFT